MNQTIRTPGQMSNRDKRMLIIGIFFLMAATVGCIMMIAVSAPKILADIGGINLIAFVFVAAVLTSSIVSPIAASLGSIFGKRRVMLGTVVWSICTMILASIVQNVSQLIIVMALYGIGSAFITVLGMITIADVCSPEERAYWLGLYGSLIGAMMIAMPLIAGLITDFLSWRWTFLAMIPFALIGFFIVLWFMPVMPKATETKIDIMGSLMFTLAIVSFTGISVLSKNNSWGSTNMIILYAVIIICIALFVFAEKRAINPIMPMSLFSSPIFRLIFIALILALLAGVPATYYLPLYLQKIRGMSATLSGTFIMGKGVVGLVLSAFNGWMISRVKEFRWNTLVIMILMTVANVMYCMMNPETSIMLIAATVVIWGIGGLYSSVFHIGTQMALPQAQIPAAMGAVNFLVTFGTTVSQIISGIFIKNTNLMEGIHNIFLTAAISGALCVLVVIAMIIQGKKIYVHQGSGISQSK